MRWWRRSPSRRAGTQHLPDPHMRVVSRAELGESPIWPILAVLTAAGLYVTLPTKFVAGPSSSVFGLGRWIVPALALLLLVPLVLAVRRPRVLQSAQERAAALRVSRRIAAIGVISVISAANAAAIVLLVHFLITGAATNARELLRAGIHLWCMNVLVFGLWFWQLDGGGPIARRADPDPARTRDFLFPQQVDDEQTPRWQPTFLDYLYVAYTNATAFSPTDAMPLSKWAKMLMLVQSAASLLLAITVVARAVNILK